MCTQVRFEEPITARLKLSSRNVVIETVAAPSVAIRSRKRLIAFDFNEMYQMCE